MERAVLLCVVLLLPCSPAERQQGNEEIESMISQLRKCFSCCRKLVKRR